MKVIFEHKSGKRQQMQERDARILQKLGRGTYYTKDMRASPAAVDIDQQNQQDEHQVRRAGRPRKFNKEART